MVKHEVAIVGGGTIGNYIAYHLSKLNIAVVVNEDNKRIGEPQHCSGLVSIMGLKRIDVWDKVKSEGLIDNEISAARFVDIYDRNHKTIRFERPVAVVLDRIGYDNLLYGMALDGGAEYFLGSKVIEIKENGELMVKRNYKKEIEKSEVIVDAEGAKRNLIKKFLDRDDKGLLPALQMDVKAKKDYISHDTVELYFNVDDFFSWIIPISKDRPIYRIGVASRESYNHYNIIKTLARRKLGFYEELRKFGGIVVSSGPINKYVFGKIVVVGDAAGHVKPTTGGGIVFGSLGAFVASQVIKKHLDGKMDLQIYQRFYQRLLSRHYKLMKFVRNTLNLIGSPGVHVFLSLIPQLFFSNIKSDMDLQSEAILKMMFPPLGFIGSKLR